MINSIDTCLYLCIYTYVYLYICVYSLNREEMH